MVAALLASGDVDGGVDGGEVMEEVWACVWVEEDPAWSGAATTTGFLLADDNDDTDDDNDDTDDGDDADKDADDDDDDKIFPGTRLPVTVRWSGKATTWLSSSSSSACLADRDWIFTAVVVVVVGVDIVDVDEDDGDKDFFPMVGDRGGRLGLAEVSQRRPALAGAAAAAAEAAATDNRGRRFIHRTTKRSASVGE